MPYACIDLNKPHNNPICGCYDDLNFTGEKRPHTWEVAEPGFKTRQSGSTVHALTPFCLFFSCCLNRNKRVRGCSNSLAIVMLFCILLFFYLCLCTYQIISLRPCVFSFLTWNQSMGEAMWYGRDFKHLILSVTLWEKGSPHSSCKRPLISQLKSLGVLSEISGRRPHHHEHIYETVYMRCCVKRCSCTIFVYMFL